jgi:beta-glucanase (GH16 family)
MKKFLIIVLILVMHQNLFSQIPPSKDLNWIKNLNLSDEFNDTQINTAKWKIFNYNYCCSYFPFINTNTTINNGFLELKADYLYGSLNSAGIETVSSNYLYGYYEISAKLPGYFNPQTNEPTNQGFWTAFWVYYQERDQFNKIIAHNEIDILEPSGLDGSSYGAGIENDAQTNEVGCWMYTSYNQITKYGSKIINNLPALYEDYHKFAVEYLPGKLIYYFDDVPFNIVLDQPSYPYVPMKVVLANQLQSFANINSNTPWPMIFKIDYFRFYELNRQFCDNDAYINNNSDFFNFQFGIRNNIYVGNGTSSLNVLNGSSSTLRAKNITVINSNFTVPIGAEFNIIPSLCNY